MSHVDAVATDMNAPRTGGDHLRIAGALTNLGDEDATTKSALCLCGRSAPSARGTGQACESTRST